MGFRSTLTSSEIDGDIWPQWFRDKYGHWFGARWEVLTTPWQVKTYGAPFSDLPQDIHRALTETGWFNVYPTVSFDMVWLHECGGLTKVQINADGIKIANPYSWEAEDNQDGSHNYCYGCSDLRNSNRYAYDATESANERPV